MQLAQVIEQPIEALVHMERYVNKGSPSGFTFLHSTSPETAPHGPARPFSMPYVRLKANDCRVFGDADRVPPAMRAGNREEILYPIHPDILADVLAALGRSGSADGHLDVYPTASGRTVLHLGSEGAFFAKLHYPAMIGRFNRALPYRKWISNFENFREIASSVERGTAPECFAILREDVGIMILYDGGENSGMGMIYREFTPYPYGARRVMIPLFALFSPDETSPSDPLLITGLLGGKGDPLRAAMTHLVTPLLDCFRFQAFELGLLPEYNAQNILLELDPLQGATRIVHRDMTGTFKDLAIRRERGLHTALNPYHATDLDTNPKECFARRSFAYDFKLGEYVFLEIESILAAEFGVRIEDFRECVRAAFRVAVTQDTSSYFGAEDKWCGYEKVLPCGGRPYAEYSNPKYR
ncbi:MAG: hypothetical protein KJ626_12790 [Verrucomicrobia bacterium]|nr:hypothetical protein [Verrucomicrobiota bacterium]